MRDFLGGVALVAIAGVASIGAAAGLGYFAYRSTAFYAPRYEHVRRITFEQSRAYQEGTLRDLQNLQLDYASGTSAQKAAIRSVALHRLADVDPSILTPELRDFAANLRSAQQ